MTTVNASIQRREPWNKGKLIGQNIPLRLGDIWAIRIHLLLAKKRRALALFDLTINSKLHRQGQIFYHPFFPCACNFAMAVKGSQNGGEACKQGSTFAGIKNEDAPAGITSQRQILYFRPRKSRG